MSMMVGARSTHSCEINVTPLIDVLLVLLIIFMVILPEHKWGEKTLVPQPSAENTEKNPPPPIVIQLKEVGESKRAPVEDQSGGSFLGCFGIAAYGNI
jgi:biopolymer transport protein TolR